MFKARNQENFIQILSVRFVTFKMSVLVGWCGSAGSLV